MPQIDIAKLVNAAKGQTAAAPDAAPKPAAGAIDASAAPTASAASAAPTEALEVISIPKPAKPPEPAADAVVPATGPTVAAAPVEYRTGPNGLAVFEVELKDNPKLAVEAEDRLDAIDRYNAHCGILGTIHKHSVRRV